MIVRSFLKAGSLVHYSWSLRPASMSILPAFVCGIFAMVVLVLDGQSHLTMP